MLVPDKLLPGAGLVATSPANNVYQAGFSAAMMLKDLKLAQEAAQTHGAATPMGAQALSLYALFAASDHEGLDFSGIIKLLEGTQ